MNMHSKTPPRAARRERRRNLILAAVSLGLSALIAEVLVRSLVSVRDVGPSFTTSDPVLGKRLKRSFTGTRVTPEFTMSLTTNSMGFRGRELNHPIGPHILFLGDSFTLGYGVSDGEEFPTLVGTALTERHGAQALPIVNAGIGDSGNGFWVRFLRSEADALEPRLVVMQFLDNDLGDNVDDQLFALSAEDTLVELPTPPPGPLRKIQGVIEAIPGLSYSHLIGLGRQLGAANVTSTTGDENADARNDYMLRLTARIVEEALETCREQGWPVLGVLVGLQQDHAAAIRDVLSRHNALSIELPSKAEAPHLYYRVDGHWNPMGHADAARRVLDALDRLQIGAR